MKKILLAAALLIGGVSLSNAGLHFNLGLGIPLPPLPPPPIVFNSAPPVYVNPPSYYYPPATVYGPPTFSFGFGGPYYYNGYYHGYRGYRGYGGYGHGWDRHDWGRRGYWHGGRR